MNVENTLYILECMLNFVNENQYIILPLLLVGFIISLKVLKTCTLNNMYHGFCGDNTEKVDTIENDSQELQDWEIQINKFVR